MAAGGRNPNAWHNWYHIIGSTYGTWLRGDPRGFRTFQHRQHVEGDYHNPPPPGVFAPVFEQSRQALRFPPVMLSMAQRQLLCETMVEQLRRDAVDLAALAVTANHFHLLARFVDLSQDDRQQYAKSILKDGRDPAPRHYVGRARKHASERLQMAGLKPASPVWAARPKCEPIRNRAHQVNVAQYIARHASQGAALWRIDVGFVAPAA